MARYLPRLRHQGAERALILTAAQLVFHCRAADYENEKAGIRIQP